VWGGKGREERGTPCPCGEGLRSATGCAEDCAAPLHRPRTTDEDIRRRRHRIENKAAAGPGYFRSRSEMNASHARIRQLHAYPECGRALGRVELWQRGRWSLDGQNAFDDIGFCV